ncbi:putative ABC transporter ATP-binding protein [Spathaspora sp. JA1]|nr:putative ABC transporter ATP-binding protein [Spathaspora sp. JA1]
MTQSLLKNCLLTIQNAKFRRDTLLKSPFIFQNSIEDFKIYQPNVPNSTSLWTITGPNKTNFLKVLAGDFISHPPLSRKYPLSSKIQFLNFRDNSGLDKVHMSARYETYSYRGQMDVSDDVNSVVNYITGLNNYNVKDKDVSKQYVELLLELFNLNHLQNKWINSLSNGQLRRARIAKSLIEKPELLIIDDPFLGLDPTNTLSVSQALSDVSETLNISVVLGLRVQDDIPSWINSLAYVDETGVKVSGLISDVSTEYHKHAGKLENIHHEHEKFHLVKPQYQPITNQDLQPPIHIEFNNAAVSYKGLVILQDFNWKIPQGSKWRILGNNGTGKTTILSLINGDHPQSWKSVISVNGKLRKTGCGVGFFDVNNSIGISSPELHALVPQHTRTMLDIIYNGLVKDVGNSNFAYRGKPENIPTESQRYLEVFQDRLTKYGNTKFIDLSMTDQKLALFLRAIIKQPKLLILDEAFSCMEDEEVMMKCHDIIENDLNSTTTVLTIGHLDWEIPKCDYMIKLHGDEKRSYSIYKVNS